MTYSLYIDEKGPQQTFRFQKNADHNDISPDMDNEPMNKIKSAEDAMMTYFAAGLLIDEKEQADFEKEFDEIEDEFKEKKYNNVKELKGAKILKRKVKRGFASLPVNIVEFYNKIFLLIEKHHAKICIFSESKFENIIVNILNKINCDGMLNTAVSNNSFIYSLTKFLADEPALSTVKILESNSFTTEEVISTIIEGLHKAIDNFEKAKLNPTTEDDVQRPDIQINNYNTMIDVLKNVIQTRKCNDVLDKDVGQFNWKKIELQLKDFFKDNEVNSTNVKLYLDEGIDKTNFDDIPLKETEENIDSKECEEIRTCDLIVTLVGSIVSKLSKEVLYTPNKPLERTLIPLDWYDFSNNNKEFRDGKGHFQLIKFLNPILNKNINYYHTIFSDDLTIFQSFVNRLSGFNSYEKLEKADKNILNEEVLHIYMQTINSQLQCL